MENVEIRRPKVEDMEEIDQFFHVAITDTYIKEGLGDLLDDMAHEIQVKKKYLKMDLDSHGNLRYFLIATHNNKIIGTIEYGPSSELINTCTKGALRNLVELGTVFVHPDYQRQGVGNLLLDAMFKTFKNRGIEEFCLDSGYTRAQKIWKKKFGEPNYLIKDYWGEGFDHMIWRIKNS